MTTPPGPARDDISVPRAVLRVVTTVAVTLFVALLGVTMIGPWMLGGKSLVVETGSMRPGIEPGDLVVITRVDDPGQLRTGDIVTVQTTTDDAQGHSQAGFVTHRIVGMGSNGHGAVLTTQGDANGQPDPSVGFDQVRGKVAYSVPKIGVAAVAFLDAKLYVLGGLAALWAVLGYRERRRTRIETARTVEETAQELADERVGRAVAEALRAHGIAPG